MLVAPVAPGDGIRRPDRPVERVAQVEPAVARIDTDDRLPARDRRRHRHRARPERRGADELPRGAGRRQHHRDGRQAGRSRPIWSATTATTTSPSCNCAAPAACPSAPLGDSSQLAVGRPRRRARQRQWPGSPLTQEAGHVIGFGRTINAKDELTGSSDELTGLIEFAAPVRAGDSGGPWSTARARWSA